MITTNSIDFGMGIQSEPMSLDTACGETLPAAAVEAFAAAMERPLADNKTAQSDFECAVKAFAEAMPQLATSVAPAAETSAVVGLNAEKEPEGVLPDHVPGPTVETPETVEVGRTRTPVAPQGHDNGVPAQVEGGQTPVDRGQTPMVEGGQTPFDGGQTPVDRGQTPMVDRGQTPVDRGQTPMVDRGQTPMVARGQAPVDRGQTPMVDGGQTPLVDRGQTPVDRGQTPMVDRGQTSMVVPVRQGTDRTVVAPAAMPKTLEVVADDDSKKISVESVAAAIQPVVQPVQADVKVQDAAEAVAAVAAHTALSVERVERVVSASEMMVQAAEAVADAILVTPGLMRGEGEILIRLKPEVLDGTSVKIAVAGQRLSVEFQPQIAETAAFIERHLPQLQQHLAVRVHSYVVGVSVRRGRDGRA